MLLIVALVSWTIQFRYISNSEVGGAADSRAAAWVSPFDEATVPENVTISAGAPKEERENVILDGQRVRGRVLTASGEPFVNATVHFWYLDLLSCGSQADTDHHTHSDGGSYGSTLNNRAYPAWITDGDLAPCRFQVLTNARGEYEWISFNTNKEAAGICVYFPGFLVTCETLRLGAPPAGSAVDIIIPDITLVPAAVIEGEIVSFDGGALHDVRSVTLRNVFGSVEVKDHILNIGGSCLNREKGKYTFQSVAPGTYQIRVDTSRDEWHSPTFTIDGAKRLERKLILPFSSEANDIILRVKRNGDAPLPDRDDVTARNVETREEFHPALDFGGYKFMDLKKGKYEITIRDPKFKEYRSDPIEPGPDSILKISLEFQGEENVVTSRPAAEEFRGSVKVKVVGASVEGDNYIEVRLLQLSAGGRERETGTELLGDDYKCIFGDIKKGDYAVVAEYNSSRFARSAPFTIDDSSKTGEVNICIPAAGRLHGKVKCNNSLLALGPDLKIVQGHCQQTAPVDPDGSYNFDAVGPGECIVYLAGGNFEMIELTRVVLLEGGDKRLDLDASRLNICNVQLSVEAGGRAVPSATVSLHYNSEKAEQDTTEQADAGGIVEFKDILAGEVTIRATVPGSPWIHGAAESLKLSARPEGSAPIKVKLPVYDGKLTITDDKGRPITSHLVSVTQVDSGDERSYGDVYQSAPTSEYLLSLPPGEYRFSAGPYEDSQIVTWTAKGPVPPVVAVSPRMQ